MEKNSESRQNKRMDPVRIMGLLLTVMVIYTGVLTWLNTSLATTTSVAKIERESKEGDKTILAYVDKVEEAQKQKVLELRQEFNQRLQKLDRNQELTNQRTWEILNHVKQLKQD